MEHTVIVPVSHLTFILSPFLQKPAIYEGIFLYLLQFIKLELSNIISVVLNESEEIKLRYLKREALNDRYSILNPWTVKSEQEKELYLIKWIKEQNISPVETKTLLEIGCGSGNNLLQFLRFGFKTNNIYGNELIEERYNSLKEKLPGINHLPGDALLLDLKPNTFDIVFQSMVFSSILDSNFKKELAAKMWQWVKPDGGILWYDFIYNNPNNKDVKGITFNEIKSYFPDADIVKYKLTLAPPLARMVCKIHPALYNILNVTPFLRTHILCWIKKYNSK